MQFREASPCFHWPSASRLGHRCHSSVLLVDGEEVAAESVSLSNTSVVLVLPKGSLSPTSAVDVRWSRLRDASGKLLTGQAFIQVP